MSTQILISLVSLIFLQYILMIDNLIFVSVLTEKLESEDKIKARRIGLLASLAMNTVLILSASYLTTIHTVLFQISTYKFTFHNLILTIGGAFLLYKTVNEIRGKFDKHDENDEDDDEEKVIPNVLSKVIMNMIFVDILFSLDSTIIAVGMTDISWIQISSVLTAIVLMFFSFNFISKISEKFPSLKVLALNFLFLIGFSLFVEGLGVEIPKALIYAAMAFSLFVELMNIKIDRHNRYINILKRRKK